jgi:hypothetical protein
MSDFGDIEDADVVDTEPPDPEALVRYFYRKRHELAPNEERAARFEDEPEQVRVLMVYVFAHIIDKLTREWQKEPI